MCREKENIDDIKYTLCSDQLAKMHLYHNYSNSLLLNLYFDVPNRAVVSLEHAAS